jgi:hypothetical protein
MVMRVFDPIGEEGYELVQPVNPDDFERLNVEVSGTPQGAHWTPVVMKCLTEGDAGEQLLPSDAPWLGAHALLLRPRAVHALSPLLAGHAELLPLECGGEDLVVVNPLHVVDALDERASRVQRFSPSGRIFIIQKHVFVPERISGLPFFKIPSLRVSPTYVTDSFVEQWRKEGLQGIQFRQVWSG